jgi:hypothetical protein
MDPDISSNSVVSRNMNYWGIQVRHFGIEFTSNFRHVNRRQKIIPSMKTNMYSDFEQWIQYKQGLWVQFNENTSSSEIWCEIWLMVPDLGDQKYSQMKIIAAISGTIAVWEKWIGNNVDILMKDISEVVILN